MDALQTIGLGSVPNDGTGDNLRTAGDKINDNFGTIYGAVQKVELKPTSIASAASHTIDTDSYNQFIITAQAEDTTFNAPTGTPVQGQKLLIKMEDNGVSRNISWNAAFRSLVATLPTATVAGKLMYIGFIYNATDSKWDCMAYGAEG